MTIKIPIFKFCLLAVGLTQLTCSLSAATQLQLPSDTPGLQSQTVQKIVNGTLTECLHVIIPNTPHSLFFPKNGNQPTTPETGLYSGAQYNLKKHSDDADKVTMWYVTQFLTMSPNTKPLNLASLSLDPLSDFIESMKVIASDSIGRTLLYRILIELYRTNEQGKNCCESYLNIPQPITDQRNICRNLKIITQEGCDYFNYTGFLCFSNENPTTTSVLASNNTECFIQSHQNENSKHIVLFHELLHWFHFLRNPIRTSNYSKTTIPSLNPYNIVHRFSLEDLWRTITYPDTEEILTILGTPQTYTHYINGDDISENAYITSLSQNNPHTFTFSKENRTYHMRWGHTALPPHTKIPLPADIIIKAFSAHDTAIKCYQQTTNTQLTNWNFFPGQAIKPIN